MVDLDAMSAAGMAPDKNGLTVPGRSYQEHMCRGQFPQVPGINLNEAGQELPDDILPIRIRVSIRWWLVDLREGFEWFEPMGWVPPIRPMAISPIFGVNQ